MKGNMKKAQEAECNHGSCDAPTFVAAGSDRAANS